MGQHGNLSVWWGGWLCGQRVWVPFRLFASHLQLPWLTEPQWPHLQNGNDKLITTYRCEAWVIQCIHYCHVRSRARRQHTVQKVCKCPQALGHRGEGVGCKGAELGDGGSHTKNDTRSSVTELVCMMDIFCSALKMCFILKLFCGIHFLKNLSH